MSRFVQGDLARYRAINDGTWLVQCPSCSDWLRLSTRQWLGLVSVDHASHYPPPDPRCSYHETHDFAADLEAHSGNQVIA